MPRSPIMSNDVSHRLEFKDRALKRVRDALNNTTKKDEPKPVVSKVVTVLGLDN